MAQEILSRPLKLEDAQAVFDLYRSIASDPGGFARAAEEITLENSEKMLHKTLQSGIGIGAVEAASSQLIGFIVARKPGPKVFDHVLSELAIGVAPQFQSRGIGRRLFLDFLENVDSRPDVLRVELLVRESNLRAISFYESIGFHREGMFEKRIRGSTGEFEADVPMGWLKNRS